MPTRFSGFSCLKQIEEDTGIREAHARAIAKDLGLLGTTFPKCNGRTYFSNEQVKQITAEKVKRGHILPGRKIKSKHLNRSFNRRSYEVEQVVDAERKAWRSYQSNHRKAWKGSGPI